jgi:hypothetical protein
MLVTADSAPGNGSVIPNEGCYFRKHTIFFLDNGRIVVIVTLPAFPQMRVVRNISDSPIRLTDGVDSRQRGRRGGVLRRTGKHPDPEPIAGGLGGNWTEISPAASIKLTDGVDGQ